MNGLSNLSFSFYLTPFGIWILVSVDIFVEVALMITVVVFTILISFFLLLLLTLCLLFACYKRPFIVVSLCIRSKGHGDGNLYVYLWMDK